MGCPLAVADRIYLEQVRGLLQAKFEKRSQR
jgi:hypothetical protein